MAQKKEKAVPIGLIDLDSTIADYQRSMKSWMDTIAAPGDVPYADRSTFEGEELPYMKARRKLIQAMPGFWRDLSKLEAGFAIVDEMRSMGFSLNVLTKGPTSSPNAWGEKLEWCKEHLPDAGVTVTHDKSLAYGKVLVDDFPPYFLPWLEHRPRGLVVCVAQPWNVVFANDKHPSVFRYDTGIPGIHQKLQARLRDALTNQDSVE